MSKTKIVVAPSRALVFAVPGFDPEAVAKKNVHAKQRRARKEQKKQTPQNLGSSPDKPEKGGTFEL